MQFATGTGSLVLATFLVVGTLFPNNLWAFGNFFILAGMLHATMKVELDIPTVRKTFIGLKVDLYMCLELGPKVL